MNMWRGIMFNKRTILVSLFCMISMISFAAEKADESDSVRSGYEDGMCGVVTQVSGTDISVYRNEIQASFQPRKVQLAGMPLFKGDIIETGDGSRLEIQLLPGKTRIMLEANTNIEIINEEATQQSFRLIFGRLRSEVEGEAIKLSLGNSIPIRVDSGEFTAEYLVNQTAPAGISFMAKFHNIGAVASVNLASIVTPDELSIDESEALILDIGNLATFGIRSSNNQSVELLSYGEPDSMFLEYWRERTLRSEVADLDQLIQHYSLLDYRKRVAEDPRRIPSVGIEDFQYNSRVAAVRSFPVIERQIHAVDQKQRLFTPNRTIQRIGIGVFTAGIATELLGITALFFGDQLLSELMTESSARRGLSMGLLVYGGALVGGGAGVFLLGITL